MPKNNQVKGKPKGSYKNEHKSSNVYNSKTPKTNGSRYSAEPGSRDRAVKMNIEKVKDLYEELSQMSDEEREKRLEVIRNQLRQTEGLFTNLAMDRLEISENIDGKSDKECIMLLKESYKEENKIANARRSLESEEKKIQLFPKVRQAMKCVEDAKNEISDAQIKEIEYYEAAIKQNNEEIERARKIEEEIKTSIAEFTKALSILENAGGNSDIIEALKNNIREKEEELDEIDIEWLLEDTKNLEEKLEMHFSGGTKYDEWITRCLRPWEDIFAGKNWEQIAEMSSKDIHLTIKNGIKLENKKENETQKGKESKNNYNSSKDESDIIYSEDQAESLRRIVKGQQQASPVTISQSPVEEHDDNKSEESYEEGPKEDLKEDDETRLKPKENFFSIIRNWFKKQRSKNKIAAKKSKKIKAEKKREKAAKNEEIATRIFEEEGFKPGRFRVFVDKMLESLKEDFINEIDFDDDIEYSLSREESEIDREVRKGKRDSQSTTLQSGPETEGARVPQSKPSKKRAESTSEGLDRALDAGKDKFALENPTFKEKRQKFTGELSSDTKKEDMQGELTPEQITAERERQEAENVAKVGKGMSTKEFGNMIGRLTTQTKIVDGHMVRPEAQKGPSIKGGVKSAPTVPVAPSTPGGDAR